MTPVHPRITVVPGLGVRDYLVDALMEGRRHGLDIDLLRPPGSGRRRSLTDFGMKVGRDLPPVDLLVGFSAGVFVAAAAAAHTPASVGALVLIGPVEAATWRELARRWMRAGLREPGHLIRQQAREWVSTPPPRLMRAMRSTRHTDLERLLDDVTCPVHVIRGEHDDLSTDTYARQLARHGGRVLVVPHANHSWPYQDPDGFVAAMRTVLDT